MRACVSRLCRPFSVFFLLSLAIHSRGGKQEEPERGHFVLARQGAGEGYARAEGEAQEGVAGGPGENEE